MGSTTASSSAMTTPQRKDKKAQTNSLALSPVLQADELSLNPRWSPHIKSPRHNTTISSRIRLQNAAAQSNGEADTIDSGTLEASMRGGGGVSGSSALASPLSKRARMLQANSPESMPPLSPVVSARKRSIRAELAQDTPFPFSPTASGLRIRYAPSSPLSPTLRSTPNRNEPESPTLTRMLVADSPSLSLDERLDSPDGIDDESPTVSQMSRSLLFRLDIESPTGRKASGAASASRSPLLSDDKSVLADSPMAVLRRSPYVSSSEDELDGSDALGAAAVTGSRHSDPDSTDAAAWGHQLSVPRTRRPSSSASRSDSIAGKLERKRRRLLASRLAAVPQIYVSPQHPRTDHAIEVEIAQQLGRIRRHFDSSFGAREADFARVTVECGLPRFANRALFRFVARSSSEMMATASSVIGKRTRQLAEEAWPPFEHFRHVWARLRRTSTDVHSLLFNILVEDCTAARPTLQRDDLKVVVSDVLDHHSELEFLEGQDHYALSYMETVIERIFYVANRSWDGLVTLAQFRRADIVGIVRGIEAGIDIDVASPGVFSYKHFYVLFCSFYELDSNRDRLLDARDLLRYFNGMLSRRSISRIIMGKGKPSEHVPVRHPGDPRVKAKAERRRAKGSSVSRYDLNVRLSDCRMTYRDFIWFLLSEIDKTSPTAVEYWFRCLDLDGDGVLTIYELEYFYDEQVSRMDEEMAGDMIMLDDLMCQLSDLVRPANEGLFTLKDLKRVAPAQLPLFFDAFMNLTRFVEHETRTAFLQRQLAQLSMRALPTTSFADVIQMRMDFLASIPNAWIEFADLEYAALLNDHQEYDGNKQAGENAAQNAQPVQEA
ncbi:Serine/threonine-protein phosphatase 2A regulatory subunit B'' subunit alpha [Coemansia sp. RSA 1804]|nr:Serine/threonine-protein phosphatase 2A regulatory subunit B'' subunit alpha [Coemansia sp. RSA 1804]